MNENELAPINIVPDKGYTVGPLIYMPGLKNNIADKLIEFSRYKPLSAAICLEDTIRDDMVDIAERNIVRVLSDLKKRTSDSSIKLPNIFIRVREPEQIDRLITGAGDNGDLITGFILPKIDDEEIERYLPMIRSVNKMFMPILESSLLIDKRYRAQRLSTLRDVFEEVRDKIINVRVGGNDFSSSFGFRNSVHQSVYDFYPVMSLLEDIATEFIPADFIVSAPVWNYFDNCTDDRWKTGLIRELERDHAMGFVGKTVIHPSQIETVLESHKPSRNDYDDALLLMKTKDYETQVIKSTTGSRMIEHKVHMRWAQKIISLAAVYGISNKE